jgi:hypothetical protein
MRKRLLLWVAAIVVLVSVAAVAADISGKWKAEVNTPDGQTRTFTFNFKVADEKLTGTVARDPQDEGAIKDGKVKGDDISFSVEGPGGMATFKGKVSADEIKFTAEFNGQSVEMTAKRLPE